MNALKEQIKKIWEFRLSQNFEECRVGLAQMKRELQIPVGPLSVPQCLQIIESARESAFDDTIQILLLSCSLVRAEGQLTLSEQLVASIEEGSHKRNRELPFQYFFQKAANFGAQRDYSAALEVFLASRFHAESVEEKVLALLNVIICLDNLGLPFEKTRSEIETLIADVSLKKAEYFQQALEQLNVFDMRIKFRKGKIKEVFSKPPLNSKNFYQTNYLKAWIKTLPYHSHHIPFDELQLEELTLANPNFYKKSYRLRTLQGVVHPQDSNDQNLTEFADRLYLWTWRWLVHPQQFPLARLLSLIKGVNFGELAHTLTDEDFLLVKNALFWISFFDPTSFEKVEKLTASLRHQRNKDYDLLTFENDFQNYLFALRDRRTLEAQDFLINLKTNPLWNSGELFFASAIKLLNKEVLEVSPSMKSFVNNLQRVLKQKDSAQSPDIHLVIDVSSDRIYDMKTKATVTSEAMSRGFELLHRKSAVTCEEFLLVTFGLHSYEPLLHDQKIFNLLARMRAYKLEELKIGVKAGRVFAIGSWNDIQFVRPLLEEQRVDNQMEWQLLISSTQTKKPNKAESLQKWIKPNLLLKKLSGKSEFTREDIEELAATSRSTANRLIKRWLEMGLLDKKGNARNTVYFLTEKRGPLENNF